MIRLRHHLANKPGEWLLLLLKRRLGTLGCRVLHVEPPFVLVCERLIGRCDQHRRCRYERLLVGDVSGGIGRNVIILMG